MASGWWKKIAPYSAEAEAEDARNANSPIKGWGAQLEFLDDGSGDGLGDDDLHDDHFYPFYQGIVPAGKRGNRPPAYRNEDDEDDCVDEVKLTHETDNAASKATDTIEQGFITLQQQVAEFKERFKKSQEEMKRVVGAKEDLEDKVEDLENENARLNGAVGMGAGNMILVGGRKGGGVGQGGQGHANLRNALMTVTEEMDFDLVDNAGGKDGILKRLKAWWLRNKPMQAEIRRISSRFGAGTTSYFIFYRFIYLQFSLLAIISIAFSILHVSYMVSSGYGYRDMITTSGYLPYFMLFSSYVTQESFYYSLMIVCCIMVIIASILEHLVAEDKNMKEVDALEVGNENPYAKEVLCAWDFSVTSQQEADDQYSSLANKYTAQLEETRTNGVKAARTRTDLFLLYSRRFLGFCLYVGVQAAAFAAIIFLTINGDSVAARLAGTPFSAFSSSVAPAALFVINSMIPPFMKFITRLEKWDTGMMHTSLLLGRQFLFNILNQLILALSYLLLADPLLFGAGSQSAIRRALTAKDSGTFNCLIDAAADGLFALVVTAFASKEIITNFAIPMFKVVAAQLTKTPLVKDPYDVVDSAIDLLGFLSNILVTFPFAPLAMVFTPVMVYIRIKREVHILMKYSAKPEKPWKAHYSGVIFTFVYLITLFITGVPAGVYFLTTKTFAKNCNIMDDYISLCASSIDPATQTCVKSQNSEYYSLFKDVDYPAVLCNRACGAFVDKRSNLVPFKEAATNIKVLGAIWDAAFIYPYIPWFLFACLCVARAMATNSRIVASTLQEKKGALLQGRIEILEKEKKKLEKANERMRNQLPVE